MSGSEMENASPAGAGEAFGVEQESSVPCQNSPILPGIDGAGDGNCLLSFLRVWSPSGPWWPTAIPREGGGTATATFTDPAKLMEWVDARRGVDNLYFHVNDLSPNTRKKGDKGDVTRIRGFHVDIDARAPEGGWPKDPSPERLVELAAHCVAEHARIGKLVVSDGFWASKGLKRPTAIIDSGGGFQCFWLLHDDEAVTPETAEAVNRMLVALLDGDDAVVDVSRIMRLPGAVNLANKKKRDRGRVDSPTLLLEADGSRRFRAGDFPAPAVEVAESGSPAAGGRVVLSSDLPRVQDLDDLGPGVSDKLKAMIVQGTDPEEPGKYGSRSEAAWAVICMMVRAGCSNDQIAAVILDPDYKISGHVLDQPRPVPYAARQIERARDQAIDPNLREMNDQFTVLGNEGGKCRVLEFRKEPTGVRGKTRLVPSLQSFEDIRNRFMNRKVKVATDKDGKDVMMPLGKWWLEHANRRQFHSLAFDPLEGANIGTGPTAQLNLWQGFSVRPIKGDWSRMRAHVTEVLAGGNAVSANYILRWMAWTLQNPDQRAEVAITFRGEPGTGKGLFGREMAGLFGQHGLHTGGSELLTGRFNLHFRDCCLLFADEVIWDGDKKAEAKVKTFLTEPTLAIEGKGKDLTSCPNMLHVIISSNSEWVVPAGPYERRYAVFDVAATYRQKKSYFAPLYAELDNGGREAMLHDMLATELGDWHPREDVPKTDALNDQKSRGLNPVDAAVLDMLREAAMPVGRGDGRGTEARPFIATGDFAEHVQRQTRAVVTWNAVSKALGKIGAEKARTQRPSGWVLPLLGDARAKWNEQPDLPPQKWDDATDWAEGDPF